MKLTKKEILDIETELKLIEKKVRVKLKERGMQTFIKNNSDFTYPELSRYKAGKSFSIKKLLQISKIIAK